MPTREERILDRLLFAGETCEELARAEGSSPCDVRAAAIAALRALHADSDGLLALYALGALDADESAAVRRAISASATLRRRYLAERDRVADACCRWSVAAPAHVCDRIVASI